MRYTSQSDTLHRARRPPTLSTLPGVASAVCSRCVPAGVAVFVSRPNPLPGISHCHCNTCAIPGSTAGSIKRAVCDVFQDNVPRECGFATQPNSMCHHASKTWQTNSTCYGTAEMFICCPAIGVPSEISQSGATLCFPYAIWAFQPVVDVLRPQSHGVGRGLLGMSSPTLREVSSSKTCFSTRAVRIIADQLKTDPKKLM